MLLYRPQSIMKKYIFLLATLLVFFASCEDIQDNDSVVQANIDSAFFKSFGTNALRTDDGITIEGLTDNESLTLSTTRSRPGTYLVGPGEPNFALFQNELGNVYSTNFSGSQGEIIITNRNNSTQTISGTFQFTAVLANLDTIFVDKGVFFDVSYIWEGQNQNTDGTFSANVDETPFNATVVAAVDSGNSLLISGSIGTRTILIRVPLEIETGNYPLLMTGFQASYAIGTDSENAIQGNISIISHDIPNGTISGSFAFETASSSIMNGQFNVTY